MDLYYPQADEQARLKAPSTRASEWCEPELLGNTSSSAGTTDGAARGAYYIASASRSRVDGYSAKRMRGRSYVVGH